jgi:hypothetical protein
VYGSALVVPSTADGDVAEAEMGSVSISEAIKGSEVVGDKGTTPPRLYDFTPADASNPVVA